MANVRVSLPALKSVIIKQEDDVAQNMVRLLEEDTGLALLARFLNKLSPVSGSISITRETLKALVDAGDDADYARLMGDIGQDVDLEGVEAPPGAPFGTYSKKKKTPARKKKAAATEGAPPPAPSPAPVDAD